jgi:hypothetical protein
MGARFAIEVDDHEAKSALEAMLRLAGLKSGLSAAALHVKSVISPYPRRRYAPQPFVSDKGRRGFFAKMRSGEIEVPYQRGSSPGSQSLGRRWTTQARDGGFTQVVGNNASYAPLVHEEASQTMYHKMTGWKTDEGVVKSEGAEVERIVDAEVGAWLSRTWE